MAVNTVERLSKMTVERYQPGITVSMAANHRGVQLGSRPIDIKETLQHKSGAPLIMCGHTKLGDKHECGV